MSNRKVPADFGIEVVPRGKVPRRNPIVYQPADQRGSMYEPILRALSKNPGRAVKIVSKNSIRLEELTPKQRRDIQSGLITISKNWQEEIDTQVESDAIYVMERRVAPKKFEDLGQDPFANAPDTIANNSAMERKDAMAASVASNVRKSKPRRVRPNK